MKVDITLSHIVPPIFYGDNYQAWAIRMTVYLNAMDLWEALEEDYDVPFLLVNLTMNQLKTHKENKTIKSKVKACLFSAVSSKISTRIMNLGSGKEIWDYLKKEYQGNEKTKNMQVLNLIKEFEMMKMKEIKTIKDCFDKLKGIVNKVRLLGKDFFDDRVMQKILVTLPEKYESKISSLKESKDLRNIRQEASVEGAFRAKFEKLEGKKKKDNTSNNNNNETYPPFPDCKKINHLPKKCWWRLDVKCRKYEFLFVATRFSTSNSFSDSWLIDSCYTNHVTTDQTFFKELDKTIISKIKVGNGEFIPVKRKGTMAIESLTGLKHITDVLYVPNIDQNLLSVGQLIEKGFKVIFEDKWCLIKDSKCRDVFKVKMKAKGFALNIMEEKPTTKQLLDYTRSLSKIYERCNVVVLESAEFKKN
ncbi:hypothetical protein ES288_D09G003700v1 [Gossypium darwinii]|uniref:Retrovirus-related Pol polyprotein from transposon TNT 1-94-like beta-barrel domain-containing protein n=1 Tax=Gossypium darwinii TaxID=34276 RepID=A0A5D2B8Y8_GOSDA|nr:hypothetical protein ES288_D09G003700v1 [Gossypium darwinii]